MPQFSSIGIKVWQSLLEPSRYRRVPRDISLEPLPTRVPRHVPVPPPPPESNVATPSWKRKKEECYLPLQQDIKSKRAKLHQLEKEHERMEEQEAMMKKILEL
ncbi:hypothetical protein DFQ28_003392 [Apophysomyces sp. BC1034]|nr:hypothetical protein DFQ30_006479 [Apophysomyces sp. BC1015]KAG0176907.1 hypothetical protein DFQ29_005478 [Apophysomyces sp. BC1021]KAG0189435.1 hypothetical protein DFQ28_003392 [Apophysomyces sp. BC1034]